MRKFGEFFSFAQMLDQWFPTFFISRPRFKIWRNLATQSKIWHSRSAPAINCSIKVFK